MKILSIVGARPNFMKISPIIHEFNKHKINHVLVHTGQHYDFEMSKLFFDELNLPNPPINLGIGSGSYGEQVGNVIMKLEKILLKEKPDLVIVVGDINSTFAGALIAKQLGIKVAHVEAGLRSFDLTMHEEINRILTDKISDYLFTTEESGNKNLIKEGISKEKIFFVGNVMIDTLIKHKEEAMKKSILEKFGLKKREYAVLTLHRPSNVDTKRELENVLSILEMLQKKIKIVFPLHPRTKKNIELFQLEKSIKNFDNLIITEPLGYLDFLCLVSNSKFVLTDSGGIQEETTILKIPCVTLRDNTERPVTLTEGTNLLVSTNKEKIVEKSLDIINGKINLRESAPTLWDGQAARRIVQILLEKCG